MIAALFFVSVLVFATGGEHAAEATPARCTSARRRTCATSWTSGSPLYFPNPFGGTGFWLDREDGQFVALDIRVPNTHELQREVDGRSINAYVDCHEDHLEVRRARPLPGRGRPAGRAQGLGVRRPEAARPGTCAVVRRATDRPSAVTPASSE